jgi:hypothetical protein
MTGDKMNKIALLASFAFVMFASATPVLAKGGHSSGSYSHSGATSGSHAVRSYTRRDGTFVHAHEAGNPNSGNHWHLNGDGTDTVSHPNGSTETIAAPN